MCKSACFYHFRHVRIIKLHCYRLKLVTLQSYFFLEITCSLKQSKRKYKLRHKYWKCYCAEFSLPWYGYYLA